MINPDFIILAVLFNAAGTSNYILKILRGVVAPNRVTWFLWGIIPIVAFSAQVSAKVGLQSLQTLAAGVFPLIVFAISFRKHGGYWLLGSLDYGCGLLSIAAVVGWMLTSYASYAILLSIAADALAAAPTVVKAFHAPQSENPTTYLCAAISSVITLLIVSKWDVARAAFPSYLLFISLLLFALTIRRYTSAKTGLAPISTSAASGYVCPVDDLAESFVVGVVVAPDDVPADHAGLLFVAGMVGVLEREVPQGRELGLGPV